MTRPHPPDHPTLDAALLRWLRESARLGILTTDTRLAVVDFNRWLEERTGRQAADTAGQPLLEAFPELAEGGLGGCYRAALEGRDSELPDPPGGTLLRLRPGAAEARHAARVGPLLSAGQVVGTITVVEDVTERARLEARLREVRRLAAVGRLAAGVAHEFNNLLTVVLGYGELLLGQSGGEEQWRLPLVEVHRAGERAAALTQQLLAFARPEEATPELVNLNTLLADLEPALRCSAGRGVTLVMQPGPDLPSVRVERARLELALLTLILAVSDAIPDSGELTLGTGTVTLAGAGAAAPGAYVALTVTATGQRLPLIEEEPGGPPDLAAVEDLVRQCGGHFETEGPAQVPCVRLLLPVAE